MSDFIDRREAINAVGLTTWAGSRISKLQTIDAVPVVRCKDCKFYRKMAATAIDYFDYIEGNTENKKPLYMCDNDVIDWATPEDYCSRGERREDE